MKIMVTGGAGFIGSNVVDGYIEAGHEVIVVDDLSSGKRDNLNPRAKFYEMDIRNDAILELFQKERPEILNHHAAQISVPDSVADPLYDADVNIKGFLNLMEAAVASGTKKVIFISSGGAIYGEADEYPTTENYLPRPLSPYAVTKYCSEKYLEFYSHHYGLKYTVLRYSNIYGPRQIRHGEAGVVAIFMDNLIRQRQSILYHFPDEPDGMVRDYCYVGDVVEANLASLHKGENDFFNIGTGLATRTLKLYQIILEAFQELGRHIPKGLHEPLRELARPGDLTKSCLVVEKAKRLLGWEPKTSLAQGIIETLKWRLTQE
ncbi:MAG TPA: NAD-dependent epimerase/dehydratase family protein [Desulfobacterales bacterium]|nr:NAD-dependent epimerase/dehydratase family protein [Desulfobacterales bacterium]